MGHSGSNYFVVTLDQKTITKNKTNVPYEKVFVIYSEKLMTSYLTCDFSKFYAPYKKTNDIFGILRKFRARNMCFLCKNIDLKI